MPWEESERVRANSTLDFKRTRIARNMDNNTSVDIPGGAIVDVIIQVGVRFLKSSRMDNSDQEHDQDQQHEAARGCRAPADFPVNQLARGKFGKKEKDDSGWFCHKRRQVLLDLNLTDAPMKAASSISRRDFLARIAATTGAGIIASGVTPLTAAEPVLTSPWQIGCYTRPFDKFDWRTAFDAIAEAGFKYAGLISSNAKDWILMRINTPREEAAKIGDGAAERGLKLLSAYGDFSVANSLAEGIDGLQKLIDNCVAARCPNLLLGGVSDPKQYAPYFKAIAESCAYAAQHGAACPSSRTRSKCNRPQCRKAIESVGHRISDSGMIRAIYLLFRRQARPRGRFRDRDGIVAALA